LNVYGGLYYQCSICSHCFLIARPSEAALKSFYTNDSHYSSTYVDKKSLETRVKEVAKPKAEWVVEQFELIYGRQPTSILDIGAGGGHFVYASKQLGLDAKGIETSSRSREFCSNNFGFELQAADFSQVWNRFLDLDIITFWGLIEHVPDPLGLLKLASKTLYGRESLVVASAPNWDSFSTAVQTFFSSSIVRHLDALGHLHIFTNSSLATAFELSGFAPVAAWYFGMDAYELFTQLAASANEKVTSFSGELLSNLQSAVDIGRLSDSIVLAGRPSSEGE
jgi:2-polyprenyl-3-methyl-5-hydroxy-6-metoxy-1,4-benzoquinol methylase